MSYSENLNNFLLMLKNMEYDKTIQLSLIRIKIENIMRDCESEQDEDSQKLYMKDISALNSLATTITLQRSYNKLFLTFNTDIKTVEENYTRLYNKYSSGSYPSKVLKELIEAYDFIKCMA